MELRWCLSIPWMGAWLCPGPRISQGSLRRTSSALSVETGALEISGKEKLGSPHASRMSVPDGSLHLPAAPILPPHKIGITRIIVTAFQR